MRTTFWRRLGGVAGCVLAVAGLRGAEGVRLVKAAGYDGCVELSNGTTRVVLEPNAGGRTIQYQFRGIEVLQQDPEMDGWVAGGPRKGIGLPAGRLDVGPEHGRKFDRTMFWEGPWTAEIAGPRRARLVGGTEPQSGLHLVRDFELAADSSQLTVTQTMHNRGKAPLRTFHWSRTLAEGGGICFAPLPEHSRFPKGYALYNPNRVIDFNPADEPGTAVRDGLLIVSSAPTRPKFALDVSPGWLAYLTRRGVLFVKTFAVYPDRAYGELAANNVSLWYSGTRATELEPIGPAEEIAPGKSASYTEVWSLHPLPYPADGQVSEALVAQVRAVAAAAR